MQILYALFGTLVSAIAIFARVFFYHAGKTSERLKSEQRDNDALRDEIDRLNSKPVTPDDRAKLFERAKIKARAREKTKP
jgi:hypothetical protein